MIPRDSAEDSELAGTEGSFSNDFHGCQIKPLFSYFMNVQCKMLLSYRVISV